jgi:hypothetical protein
VGEPWLGTAKRRYCNLQETIRPVWHWAVSEEIVASYYPEPRSLWFFVQYKLGAWRARGSLKLAEFQFHLLPKSRKEALSGLTLPR